jgi:hypothetical protein
MRTGASTDAIPREATDGRAARATTGRSWAGKARAERSAPSDGAPAAHAGMSRPRGARDGHATARANVDLDVPALQPYVEAATATRGRLCVLSGDAAPAAAVGRCRGPRTANGGARSSADPAVRSCASRTIGPASVEAFVEANDRRAAQQQNRVLAPYPPFLGRYPRPRDRVQRGATSLVRFASRRSPVRDRLAPLPRSTCYRGVLARNWCPWTPTLRNRKGTEAGTVDRSARSRREQLPAPCSGSVTFA